MQADHEPVRERRDRYEARQGYETDQARREKRAAREELRRQARRRVLIPGGEASADPTPVEPADDGAR
jgi:hypothetical protein